MSQIEQEFLIHKKADSPSYYLGNDIKRVDKNKYLHISSKNYVTEVLRLFQQKYGAIKKKSIPMRHQKSIKNWMNQGD